ncbi:MAG: hypothetical protein F6K45_25410 [Kamptonema sp. SIO1D9]|nr:hypothetical protein [Kamptonema sp. SIO1D9]
MTELNYNYEYQVGGSLPTTASSYVTRQADREFYEALRRGQFCYVLNSRQMGKSSLRVRTMERLQAEGILCAFIDLTGIGKEGVTPEKWYAGIINSLVNSCQLRQKIQWRNWWRERRDVFSPVQRLNLFIEEIFLAEIKQNIVVFIDEIDRVLSQNFSLDDFFALIRLFSNQRVDNSAYQRLTFALLGVATPSDLIQDKTQTPFNIGKAIELHGFQFSEVQPLVKGLENSVNNPQELVKEILVWTGGQPFLTQKVCLIIARHAQAISLSNISQNGSMKKTINQAELAEIIKNCIVDNWEAKDEPEHLRTIRDRLLRNEQRAGQLLEIYRQILAEGEILAEGSSEQTELRLSGLVVQQQGKLKVYNRIYAEVFNLAWIDKELGKLRPYATMLKAWIASNYQDDSRLLRGQALQDALSWANSQSLSPLDYRFLAASQDLEKREVRQALAVQEQESQILAEANSTLTLARQKAQTELKIAKRQARMVIGIGSVILTVSVSVAIAVKYQVRQAQQELAEVKISLISLSSEKAFNSSPFEALLKALKAGKALQSLEKSHIPSPETRTEVISALRKAISQIKEQNRLELHQNQVRSVSFSPNGQLIASGSADKTVKLWTIEGRLLHTLVGHQDNIWSVSFSPDGETIASTGDDGTIRLWQVKDGSLIQTLKGHNERLSDLSFSPDGQLIASTALDGTIGLWNLEKPSLVRVIEGHRGDIASSLSFSPDGTLLASASFFGTVKLWKVSNGTLVRTLTGHSDRLTDVSFSPHGKTLASASFDRTIKLWDVETGTELRTFEGHRAPIWSVSFSPDGKSLVSASEDNTIKIWNLFGEDIEPQTLRGHSSHVKEVSFSPDGKFLVSASDDSTVRVWQINGIEPKILEGHLGTVWSVNFSSDGKILASASADGTVKLWRVSSGTELQTLPSERQMVRSLSFSPNAAIVAFSSDDSNIKLWNLKHNRVERTLKGHSAQLFNLSFSPDGKTLAAGYNDGIVELWSLKDGSLIYTFKGHGDPLRKNKYIGISFSRDRQTLASGGNDRTIKLWNLENGMLRRSFFAHHDTITSLSFSPNGELLASASMDGTVKLWRVDDSKPLHILKGHQNVVGSVSFSPDGKTLASGSLDSLVKLWDVQTGTLLETFQSHRNWVNSLTLHAL